MEPNLSELSIRPVRERWAVPVSLQPRAARHCEVVDPATKRPAPRSSLGFHVRPKRRYQVMVIPPEGDLAPSAVRLIASRDVHREPSGSQSSHDGHSVYWLDFEPRREEGWPWYLRGLFSETQMLSVRLEYSDGRDDYEQPLSLVVTPSRAWVLWSLTVLVFFYLLSRLMDRLLASPQTPSALADYLWQLVRNPVPSVWLVTVIAGLWFVVSLLDRAMLLSHWYGWRKAHRSEWVTWRDHLER